MKLLFLVILFLVGSSLAAGQALRRAEAGSASVPGQYIVVLRDSADPEAEAKHAEKTHGAAIDHVYHHALKGYAFRGSAKAAAALAKKAEVAYVAPDQLVSIAAPSLPLAGGDSAPTGVRRIGASAGGNVYGASTVNVAVIDTGVNLTHPDLNAVNGKNCTTWNKKKNANDDNGHGSHVAGTIGARNNGSGVVGMAPATKIYAVKVLNSAGSGTWSQVICGVDWVTANAAALNIKVANMSLGGGGTATPSNATCGNSNIDSLHTAICRSTQAGVTYVVAAGNSNANFSGFVPAAYEEVLSVTAITDSDGAAGGLGGSPTCRPGEADDTPATFSNYATPGSAQAAHAIAAPGVCIHSTWKNGGYSTISGTRMASPHAAGLVALCLGSSGVPGGCAGLAPSAVITKVRADAAAVAASNGYTGIAGRDYGSMAFAGGY